MSELHFAVERTYEVTMDYMVKHWTEVSRHATREEADAEIVRLQKEFSSLDCMYAVVDHTPKPAPEPTDYEAIDAMWSQRYWSDRAASARAAEEAEQAIYALKGQTVTVVKGRKVPVGTTGEVFWVGEGKYGWRVGFNDAEGETHWTALSNVEAVTEGVAA